MAQSNPALKRYPPSELWRVVVMRPYLNVLHRPAMRLENLASSTGDATAEHLNCTIGRRVS